MNPKRKGEKTMNEILINGVTLPADEFFSYIVQLCVLLTTFTSIMLWLAKEFAYAVVDIIDYVKRYLKRKKAKKTATLFDSYAVEEVGGCGVVYKNDAETVVVCNSYENALLIKGILEDDDELPYTERKCKK